MAKVQRFDVGRLDRTKRTGAGGVRMPATIARTGIQTYRRADGREIREYRPPEQVFAQASVDTLGAVPVTIGHPGAVTPANWRTHAVGHVSEAAPVRKQDGGVEWLEAQVVVSDAAALARVERGDLVEVSMGYTADVVETPGVINGEHYDAIQTNVQFNHLALLPPGRARAGAGARLRLDSKGNELMLHEDGGDRPRIKVDGIDCEAGSDTHISLLEKQVKAATERADAAEAAQKAAETATGAAKAELATVTTERDALKARDVGALVQDELDFRTKLLPALPAKYDFTGKTREQVRHDAVGADVVTAAGKLPEGERAGYITYALEAKLKTPPAPKGAAYVVPKQDANSGERKSRKNPQQLAYEASFPKA